MCNKKDIPFSLSLIKWNEKTCQSHVWSIECLDFIKVRNPNRDSDENFETFFEQQMWRKSMNNLSFFSADKNPAQSNLNERFNRKIADIFDPLE